MAGNSESRFVDLRGRGAGGEDRRRPRPAAQARGDHLDRAGARARSRSTRCASAAAARDAARGRRARRRRQARGPVHDHLHVRHDRPAQGLRADPRQLPPGHQHVRGDRRHRGGRARLPVPPARALLRAADPAAVRGPRRAAHLLERRPEPDRAGPDGDQAGLPAERPAHLREDLHARHVQQRPGEDRRRDAARAEGPADARGRPGGARRSCRPRSTRPTPSSSSTSATSSAATSSRPPPAPPRSARRSSSSSTPAARPCSRATG